MEKAYDIKELGLKLKARGLDVLEESLKIFIEETFDFLEESAKLSATPMDNMAALIYPEIEKFLLGKADAIYVDAPKLAD